MKTQAIDPADQYDMVSAIPFLLFHASCFAVIFTGISVGTVALGFALLFIRMWSVTAGYHRYFSHKTFKTSRTFQFILAFIAQSTAQQGVVWWANHHRIHHQASDTEKDVHSPRHRGFWYSHWGWIFTKKFVARDYTHVNDWEQYPELMWLDEHRYIPAIVLGAFCWLVAGWQGVVVSFCISTIVLYHCTFSINSLSHVYGKQRYLTGDDSRNNWWLAILTMGEGWHNNHHHYSTCARQGFRWWEIDVTYYIIKLLEKCRIVWDVKEPPAHIIKGPQAVPQRVRERTGRLFDNTTSNFNIISNKLSTMANDVLRLIDQPQLSHDFAKSAEQLKETISDKMRNLEQLPPKVAAVVTERVNSLLDTFDKTLKSISIKEHLDHCAKTLDELATSFQISHLIPERVSARSVS